MSDHEKRQLKADIESLSDRRLKKVGQIIQTREPPLWNSNPEELEIDFDTLKASTLNELKVYIATCSKNKSRKVENKKSKVASNADELKEKQEEKIQELEKRLRSANQQLVDLTNEKRQKRMATKNVNSDIAGPSRLSATSSNSSNSDSSSSSSGSSSDSEADVQYE